MIDYISTSKMTWFLPVEFLAEKSKKKTIPHNNVMTTYNTSLLFKCVHLHHTNTDCPFLVLKKVRDTDKVFLPTPNIFLQRKNVGEYDS